MKSTLRRLHHFTVGSPTIYNVIDLSADVFVKYFLAIIYYRGNFPVKESDNGDSNSHNNMKVFYVRIQFRNVEVWGNLEDRK